MDTPEQALMRACGIDPDRAPTKAEREAFLFELAQGCERLKASVARIRATLTPAERRVVDLRFGTRPKQSSASDRS